MFSRRFRRSSQRRLLRVTLCLLCALFLLDTLTHLKNYREFSYNLLSHTYTDASGLPAPVRDQKIFICAQFWTNAWVIEQRWGEALLKLIETLGADNVYVSIYESGSLDNTKDVLKYLDDKLIQYQIRHTITLDPTTHEDEIKAGPFDELGNPRPGWVLPPGGTKGKEIRRIPYLAKLRNLAFQPLLTEKEKGRTYDKILFLNDVVFRPSDVLSLLATNGGSYSAACSLDFHYPAHLATYYDTFALRDSNGEQTLAPQFPYFRSTSDSLSSILQGISARVASCWNGMVLMDTSPFYSGLTFRAIPDSLASKHLEGSECCLIHADLNATYPSHPGIYVNPAVRVGYTTEAYDLTHFGPSETFISSTQYVLAMWLHRLNRVRTPSAQKQMRTVAKRLGKWKEYEENSLEKREEKGEMCLIDEMHLLIWNGWKHA
jgi:Cryptococcal mannosyltransferase 1